MLAWDLRVSDQLFGYPYGHLQGLSEGPNFGVLPGQDRAAGCRVRACRSLFGLKLSCMNVIAYQCIHAILLQGDCKGCQQIPTASGIALLSLERRCLPISSGYDGIHVMYVHEGLAVACN